MPRRRPLQHPACLAVLVLAIFSDLTIAAAPTLDALYPAGLRVGSTAQVTAVGKAEPWPADLHCSNPEVSFKADPKKKGVFTATATEKAEPGPCIVHLVTKQGASKPMVFVLGSLPETMETLDPKGNENNDSIATAQRVEALPLTINGRLGKSEDIDIYLLSLKKGQTLVASLDAYGLRASLDPYLHLYDSEGSQIALGNDNGINLDPFLAYKIPRDGDYTLAVMAYAHPPGSNIRFTGNSSAVYRLSLTTGPWLSHALPLAVQRTGKTALQLFGYNLPEGKPHIPLDFTHPDTAAGKATIRHPAFPNHLDLPITSANPVPLDKPTHSSVPLVFSGQLSKPGESDRLGFVAKKGQALDIRVASRRFGFPLDPVLSVQNAAGKVLKRVDDGNVKTDRDARLSWSAPEDGNYTIEVSDLFRKGGDRWHYLLTVEEAEPTFSATVEKPSYTVEAEKSVEMKINIERLNGHKTAVKISADNLPAGISMVPPTKIPDKTAQVTFKIEADSNVSDATLPIQFTVSESKGDPPTSNPATYSFLPEIPGGPYLLNETANIWLTVKGKPKPPPPAKKDPKENEPPKEKK